MTYTKEALYNTSKRVKRKKTNQMHYPLDKLYYAEVNGGECIVCEMFVSHKPKYKALINIPNYNFIDIVLDNNFKIIKSLKEEIDSKKINVCLLTQDGKDKRELTIKEIINIIKLTTLLENKSFDVLDDLCTNISDKVSDLLGINIYSNPSSNLKLKDVEEIAVPATKVLKFKTLLFNYIKISIILDSSLTITNNDYRIIRALKGARIKTPEFENEFVLTVNSKGEETLECSNVEKGFQKQNNKNKYKNA